MKQTNNVIHIKIYNNSTLLILYFNCIINLKHIQTENVKNNINQYTYTQT